MNGLKLAGLGTVIGLSLLFIVVGCTQPNQQQPAPPPPEPTVRVERQEDVNGVKLTIWFDNHNRTHYGNGRYSEPFATFTLDDKEKLEKYKKQLEFAISQIEEVEQRMNVHEPEAKQ